MTDVFDEALATIKRAVLAIEQEVRRLSGPLESAEARLSALNAAAEIRQRISPPIRRQSNRRSLPDSKPTRQKRRPTMPAPRSLAHAFG
jgi:hypothetical protein